MRRKNLEWAFVEQVFNAYWERADATVAEYEGLRPIVTALGVDPDWFEQLAASEEITAELARSTDLGIERGVFGVPTIFVENEMFWGKDRMDFVDDELTRVAARARDGVER
jgi:2-hydroxychromene-2-carboxylate isomerase